MRSKRIKIIIILIVVVLSTLCLCACSDPYNMTRVTDINLPSAQGKGVNLGEYRIADYMSGKYTLLPSHMEGFEEFLKNSEYYCGKIFLSNVAMLQFNNEYFNAQDECFLFCNKGVVWVGKRYTSKFFYFAQVSNASIRNNSMSLEVSYSLFSEKVMPVEVGAVYSTPLSWEQIKRVFESNSIDEIARTVTLKGDIFELDESGSYGRYDGYTTLIYNQEDSTIMISQEYEKAE